MGGDAAGRRGGAGDGGDARDWVSVEAVSGVSSSSSVTEDEDDAASSPADRGGVSSSSSSCSLASSSVLPGSTMLEDGAAAGLLYELSTMLEDLPAIRTGLSKYYQGRSQSFTSLAGVTCVQDLAKKTAPQHTRRARRGYAAALGVKHRLPTTAKKVTRGAPCRARRAGLAFRDSRNPDARQRRDSCS